MVAVPACSSKDDKDNKVEVFTWWSGPGEEEGLNALVADFKKKNSDIEFINAAVAGGSGSKAKAALANRLQQGDPPDTYQRHAGKELADDIKGGYLEDLGSLYDQENFRSVMPAKVLDYLTIEGKIYSVPVNVHRSNVLWFNPKTLQAAGISAPPKTWDEFLSQAEQLKAKGKIALSIGPLWTQKHLLENVLLGELGVDKYDGLWNGKTDWKGLDVASALDKYKRVLGFSNLKEAAQDWQPQLDKVIDGSAAYAVMGDWANSYLANAKKLTHKTDYDTVNSPGTDGVFNFLSDTFTLPKNAKHRESAVKWLKEVGSKDGQDAFNPLKGSIPVRTDVDKSKYTGYLTGALADWQNPQTKIVGSLAHGVVASNGWNEKIDTALGLFVQDGNVGKFADAIKAGQG